MRGPLSTEKVYGERFQVTGRLFGNDENHIYRNIYLGENIESGDQIVIKAVEGKELFLNESHALDKLDHPGIVKKQGTFDVQEIAHIVTNYIPEEFSSFFKGYTKKDTKFSYRVHELLESLCEAVLYHTNQGVIHRDINPNNIRIDNGRPILFDYDYSHHKDFSFGRQITIGTGEYTAPECDTVTPTPKYDVYSVGMIGLMLLTNHKEMTNKKAYRQLTKRKIKGSVFARENEKAYASFSSGAFQRDFLADINSSYPSELVDAINDMICIETKNRPTPQQAYDLFT